MNTNATLLNNLISCIIAGLILSFTLSCAVNHDDNILNRIPDDTLRGRLLDNYINSRRACLAYTGEYVLVTIVINEEEIIQIRDKNDGSLIACDINIGKGRNELMNYIPAGFNAETNELHFISPINKSYKKYIVIPQRINLIEEIQFDKDFPLFNAGVVFDNDYLILSTFFDGHNIAVYDKTGKYITHVSNHLLGEEVDYNQRYHQPRIAANNKKQVVVTGDIDLSYLALYSYKNGMIGKTWGKYLVEPDYNIRNRLFYFGKTHIDGIEWLELTNDRIYVLHDFRLYRDRTSPRHTYLLVFDYNGKLLYKYFLDHKIYTMSLDTDGKTFYGVTEYPDILFVKYTLP
jgi:hypothetical protein